MDILQKRSTYPDIFVVSGMEKNDLVGIVPSEEKVGSFCAEEDHVTDNSTQNNEVLEKRFIVLKGRNLKSSFVKLCEMFRRKTVHWLKYKDGKLLWKKTRGDIENLLDCIGEEETSTEKRILRECMKSGSCKVNEETIWDLGERTVLVVAEPGMGKSSTTTQVAWNTKLADPTSWVVRINWNDHTRKLQEINTETFNPVSLVEFLFSAELPNSKYTDINRNLLKQALQDRGNVTVLMDGFDEISPIHADKATAILSERMKTKVERVWVTSRPVQKEKLEKELSVTAYGMRNLSYEPQKLLLLKLLLPNISGYKDQEYLYSFIHRSLFLLHELYPGKNCTVIPVLIKIIATCLELVLVKHLKSRNFNAPTKIDLIDVYDTFVERKFHIYETEKKREDFMNASVQDDHEILKEIYLEKLEKSSLLVTLPSDLNPLSKEEIQFLEMVQDGKDKIGIVKNVVDKRPNFKHRSVAEYFTARWLS